jgi:hypothetical protein
VYPKDSAVLVVKAADEDMVWKLGFLDTARMAGAGFSS